MGKSSNPTFAGDKEFEKIHLKEKFSYGLGDVACNVVYALTTSLLIYFYTNVVGISAAMIGTIMLFSRFFDGISDVLIGHLVDRTHSKHGKSRAWILWMMIPYGIAAILLFTVPPATPIVKGIYVFITYNFCTTVVYTALNLPYATLATLMTRDTDQRAVVNLFRTGMSALGNMVITAITFPLVTRLGDTQQAWIEVSILYAIVSIIMLFICFKNCHERVKEETKTKDGKNVPLWMGIKLCVTNKYFIMFFMLAVFLSFYEAVTGTCNAYYAQYILGNHIPARRTRIVRVHSADRYRSCSVSVHRKVRQAQRSADRCDRRRYRHGLPVHQPERPQSCTVCLRHARHRQGLLPRRKILHAG